MERGTRTFLMTDKLRSLTATLDRVSCDTELMKDRKFKELALSQQSATLYFTRIIDFTSYLEYPFRITIEWISACHGYPIL